VRHPPEPCGVLASQGLWQAVEEGWISSGEYRFRPENIQPASLDLRLTDHAWALRCSFLPGAGTPVMDRVEDLALDRIDLRDGATLERDRPYLIPLVEELDVPHHVRAKANPKSSTGRLDVFTRVITDGNHRFDEVPAGHRGRLYIEVVPRSFAVRVERLLSLNQLRLAAGDPRVSDGELARIHSEFPLLYIDKHALPAPDLPIADGLFLSVDLSGPHSRIVGYRAKRNSNRLDMSGYDKSGRRFDSRAAQEIRARDVPFVVEHRQPICKLASKLARVAGMTRARSSSESKRGALALCGFVSQRSGHRTGPVDHPHSVTFQAYRSSASRPQRLGATSFEPATSR
jgi:deoxycytidine triphosphate deaminase